MASRFGNELFTVACVSEEVCISETNSASCGACCLSSFTTVGMDQMNIPAFQAKFPLRRNCSASCGFGFSRNFTTSCGW